MNETTVPGEDVQITQPQTAPDRNPNRGQWGRKLEFILSSVGFAVGLGNIWRFPYLCYSNGGGAFLIPYVLMLSFVGLPLFYMELAVGQYASLGSISIFKLAPIFKGVGYAMMVVGALVGIYYNVIISYTFFYFFASFTTVLPWQDCNNWWNDNKTCISITDSSSCDPDSNSRNSSGAFSNVTNMGGWPNITSMNSTNSTAGESPAAQYWNNYVLDRSSSINDMGLPRWHLTLCLLLAWTIIFLCIIKGIKSAGKVAYFTATFPYVVLIILFFRGVTLEGAGAGVLYYIRPNMYELAHAKVWRDAAIQILYSLGCGFGGLISMGSFNKFQNNCQKDAIVITLINCGTSVFAGFVIFSVLGYMSHITCKKIEDVAEEGPGLAFVAYPAALALMPGGPFWSIMFFFMLILLGVNSQFVGIQCMVTAIVDDVKYLQKRRTRFTLVVCVLGFFLGIPCVTRGGIYLVELMDMYATSIPLLIIVMCEVMSISWVYGFWRFRNNIETMLGFKPNYYWVACWAVIIPVIALFLLIFSGVEYRPPEYKLTNGHKIYYPSWAESVGWMMSFASIISIPIFALVKFCKCIGSIQGFINVIKGPWVVSKMTLEKLWTPTDGWGPALKEHREKEIECYVQFSKSKGEENSNKVDMFVNGHTILPVESHI